MSLPDSFSSEDKERLAEEYSEILMNKLLPSFKSMAFFLKSNYLSAGRESSGIADIPNGEAYYNHAIKLNTTTNSTNKQAVASPKLNCFLRVTAGF